MRPATDVHHLRPSDTVVGLIAISLQNPLPLAQEFRGTIAPSAQLKSNTVSPPGLPYCQQVRLMIGSSFIVHLHRNGGFVGL